MIKATIPRSPHHFPYEPWKAIFFLGKGPFSWNWFIKKKEWTKIISVSQCEWDEWVNLNVLKYQYTSFCLQFLAVKLMQTWMIIVTWCCCCCCCCCLKWGIVIHVSQVDSFFEILKHQPETSITHWMSWHFIGEKYQPPTKGLEVRNMETARLAILRFVGLYQLLGGFEEGVCSGKRLSFGSTYCWWTKNPAAG